MRFLVRPDLPEPLAVRWTAAGAADFAPFVAVAGAGAALIVVIGWAVLLQAVPLSRPAMMRRIMMGAGLSMSLFVTTVLAAVLVGPAGPGRCAGIPGGRLGPGPRAAARPSAWAS